MIRTILFSLVALLVPPTAQATDHRVNAFTLDNGLQALVLVDRRAPVVTHMVWYRVGAADDPAGKSGIAHFLEHLMFKGTDDLEAGELSRIVAENGGTDNAFTSYDHTAYFQRVASDRLELMMQMEADRMRDLVLTDEAVETELSVIREERGSRIGTSADAVFQEQARAALYLNHPYGRPVIGWPAEIDGLTRQDAESFYRAHYAPDNAILIVAGDVDPDQVQELAQTYFGDLEPSGIGARARPPEPEQLSPRRMRFDDPRVRQAYVSRDYLAPNRQSGDQAEAAALTVLGELLGGGRTSFLNRKLVLDQGIALTAGAAYAGTQLDNGTFGIFVVPVEGVSLSEAEAQMDAALEDFVREGPEDGALERVKAQIRAATIYSLDNQAGRARRYGRALTAGLTIEDVETWSDVLQAVTLEDVMTAAEDVFDLRRSVTGWVERQE